MSKTDSIKAKLGLDVFKVGREKHIVLNKAICGECKEMYCLYVCPAEAYSLNEQKEVQIDTDGCLECGTCKIVCTKGAIDWNYPQGGFGVHYRFG